MQDPLSRAQQTFGSNHIPNHSEFHDDSDLRPWERDGGDPATSEHLQVIYERSGESVIQGYKQGAVAHRECGRLGACGSAHQ